MKSSDVVAIMSVLVAGVIAPVITMMSVRWQVSHASRSGIESERRAVLDEAIVEISRFMRATGQARAIWRHGHFADSEEAQEQLRVRTAARQGAIAAYGRICLRFGPGSKVATSYAGMDQFMDALDISFRSFRRREPLTADRESDMNREYEGLVTARDIFLEVAHEVQLGNIQWSNGLRRGSLAPWQGRWRIGPRADPSNYVQRGPRRSE